MQHDKQKNVEQHYFKRFAQDYLLPSGDIEYSESPDVLIHGSKTVGIEIANLYKSDAKDSAGEQIQNDLRAKVIKAAERMYMERGGRKIELKISFDPKHPIKVIDKTANDLANVAQEISNFTQPYESLCTFEHAPELWFLYHDGKEYMGSSWELVQVHDAPNLSVERVKQLVAQKTAKVAKYRHCGSYWLLLVVEFWDPTQDQDIQWPSGEKVGQTPFERILLYKPLFNKVIEVRQ